MKTLSIATVIFAAPLFAFAELNIEPLSASPGALEKAHELRSSNQKRFSVVSDYPTLDQLVKVLNSAKERDERLAKKPELSSFTREFMVKAGCTLSSEAPSGVEKKSGGLNGVTAVYACEHGYVQTYEYEYMSELTQKITVFDDDFASRGERDEPLIKEVSHTVNWVKKTNLRWLSSRHEVRFEIYSKTEKDPTGGLERALKDAMLGSIKSIQLAR